MQADRINQLPPLTAFHREDGKVVSLLCRIIAGFALLFSFVILAANGAVIAGEGGAASIALCLFLTLAFAGGLFYLKISDSLKLIFVLALGFSLRLLMVLFVDCVPVSDFALFYEGAQCVLSGDLSYFDNYYFTLYPNLIPIVYFYAFLFKLSNTLLFAKLVNVLLMTASLYLLYAILRRLAGPRPASVAAFLYAISPSVIEKAPQLTNQHLAMFFFLLGVFLLIRRQTLLCTILAALSIAVGDLFRSEAIVIHAAFFVLLFLLMLDAGRDRGLLKRRLKLGICYFVTVYLAGVLLTAAFTGISKHAVSTDSSFQWKFIVGFNDEESGTYSGEDVGEFLETGDGMAIIRRRVEAQQNWPDFFWRKLKIQWGSFEDLSFTFSNLDPNADVNFGPLHTDVRGILRRGQALDKGVYLLILLLFGAGAGTLLFQKRRITPPEALMLLIFDAYFCAYLLIEVAPRYRYFILPFLLIVGGAALHQLGGKQKSQVL